MLKKLPYEFLMQLAAFPREDFIDPVKMSFLKEKEMQNTDVETC